MSYEENINLIFLYMKFKTLICILRSYRSHNDPCTTCYRVRRKGLLHPPGWALSSHSRITLCDCTKSEFTPRPIGLVHIELLVSPIWIF